MKEAIQKAIEGGYKAPYDWDDISWQGENARKQTLLDPLFWSSLGRALGWSTSCYHRDENNTWKEYRHVAKCNIGSAWWEIHWYWFIDHLIAGKDPDEFFTVLLADHD